MKLLSFVLFILIVPQCMFAQKIKIFQEQKQNGYVIYGSNKEFFPISVILDFNLTNMKFSEDASKILVVPPGTEKYNLGELTVVNSTKQYNFSYKFKTAMGDLNLTNTNQTFGYELPYQKGKSIKVYQGYNGTFSHKDQKALDFTMPEGTDVLAAREGTIVDFIQNNTEACPREECKKYNNYVTVMHDDGTFAQYVHIQYNSVKVTLGAKIKTGDVIAHSGNVGWTNGPHLHFVCFSGGFDKWKTLETKFKIDKGEKVITLNEGMTYLKDY